MRSKVSVMVSTAPSLTKYAEPVTEVLMILNFIWLSQTYYCYYVFYNICYYNIGHRMKITASLVHQKSMGQRSAPEK